MDIQRVPEALASVLVLFIVGGPAAYIAWKLLARGRLLRLGVCVGAVVLAVGFAGAVLPIIWLLGLVIVGMCALIFIIHVVLALPPLFRDVPTHRRLVGPLAEATVAVLIPARDEEHVIEACLDSVLASDHPAERLDVLVIDDGSIDTTAEVVSEYAATEPCIRLLVRPSASPRGKAAALNDGLRTANADFVCVLDADHQVSRNFFQTALIAFTDPRVACVQAVQIGRNWAQNWLTRLSALDFVSWQYCFLNSKSRAGLASVSFGSGCLFRTHALESIGGFDNDLATEDVDVSFRLYEAGYRVVFESGTYVTDELVSDVRSFVKQRYRWALGTAQAVPMHWRRLLTANHVTRRERVDVLFYLTLVTMMFVPYFMVATYALAALRSVGLSATIVVLPVYVLLTWAPFLVGGLSARRGGFLVGASSIPGLVLSAGAMLCYYGLLMAPTSLKAFIDHFVVRGQPRTEKAVHHGSPTAIGASRRSKRRSSEVEVLLALACPSLDPERADWIRTVLEDVRWPRLLDLSCAHDVAGFVHANIQRTGLNQAVPSKISASLLAYRRDVLARNMKLQNTYSAATSLFGKAGIDVIPLKGFAFLEKIYSPDVRPMWDIDLLVRPEVVDCASQQLESIGYLPVANPTLNGESWCTERLFVDAETRTAIDLHWDLVNIRPFPRISPYPIADLWATAEPTDRPFVHHLSPEHVVLHTAIHASLHHHSRRLIHLVDLAELVSALGERIDWPRVEELASRSRLRNPTHASFLLAHRLVAAAIPDSIISGLTPPRYRRLLMRPYGLSERSLVRLPPKEERPRWGWSSLALAHDLRDSLRVLQSHLTYGRAVKGWENLAEKVP
jgi:cellulose synthase/poly-beta-1,6-N-acetylglucosamine synthase-like glycosyltransferase